MANGINTQFIKKKTILGLVIILIFFIAGSGYFYHTNEVKTLRHEKENELKAIAKLKINQIADWYVSRLQKAEVLAQNNFLLLEIQKILSTNSAANKTSLKKFLVTFAAEHRCNNIIVTSPNGVPLSFADDTLNVLNPLLISTILKVVQQKTVLSTDIYRCSVHNKIQIDFVSPLRDNTNRVIAAIVFRLNPNELLFPLITFWPTPSKTSESLLLRRDGDSVLFLNELRHQKNTSLFLKLPITSSELPAAQVVSGRVGMFDGVDYRGVDVLSYVSPVSGTPWSMVVKIDKSELFEELEKEAIIVITISLLLILLIISGLSLIYRDRQKNIYRALWEAHEEFRTTLYSIGDAVITADKTGKVNKMNPVAETLTGWKESDAIGKPLENAFKIINEDTRDKVQSPVEKVISEGVVVGLANHTLLISKEGKEIPIADSGAPIKDKDNNIVGVVLVFRDQTEERMRQQILRESEAKFRFVFESANVGKSITLPTGEINVNQAFCEMLGYTQEELRNKKWQDITPAEEIVKTQKIVDTLIKGEKNSIRFNKKYLHKNGSFVWADVSTVMQRDRNNKPLYLITTVVDITDRKQAEDSMHALFSRQEAILSSVPDIIMEVDNNKVYRWANHAGLEFFGKDVIGKEASFYFEGEQETYEIVEPLFQGKENTIYVESWQRRKDGEKRLLAWWCRVLKDVNGNVFGTLSAAQDITERKKTEIEIIKINKELEAKVEEKTKELKERVVELERFHDATIDRELRIKELRDEVIKLKEKIR